MKKGRRKGSRGRRGDPQGTPRASIPPRPSQPAVAWLAFAVGLFSFLLYLPSLRSGFVYDAQAQIVIDDYLHDRSHFADVLSFRVLAQDVLDGTRPMQLLSLMVDALFWGKNPFGYHLTSNLLHAANAALLFLLLARLGPGNSAARWTAALAALVFAAHPVLVEPVAEVSSREDVLATFFLLLSLLLAFRWVNDKAGVWTLAGCLAAVPLACASKETGVAAPFLLLGCGLLFRGETPLRRWLAVSGGALALAGLFFAARFALQPDESEIFLHKPAYLGGSLKTVFLIQPYIWAFQIRSLFWPTGLSADYVAQNVRALSTAAMVAILAVFLLAQGLAAWKSRIAALGLAMFWLGLAPVSNFIPIYRPVADRYLYLPMAGLAMTLCGVLLFTLRWRRVHAVLLAVAVCGIGVLAGMTVRREEVFANSLNLWTDAFAKSPHSDTAANNLAYALLEEGNYTEALKVFDKAVRLTRGKKPNVWAGAAVTLEKLGRPADAEAALDQAIGLEEIYADPDRVVKSMLVTQEQADVLRAILRRKALRSVPADGAPGP